MMIRVLGKRHFYKAREAANRPDLHLHDLRHLGAVLAALSGATLAELWSLVPNGCYRADRKGCVDKSKER